MSNEIQKFSNMVSKDRTWTAVILVGLAFIFSCWVAIIAIKTKSEPSDELVAAVEDNQCDFLKLFLVWTNVFMLGLLLFQKKVLLHGSLCVKTLFGAFLIGLNVTALINLALLIKISSNPTNQNTFLPYNYDWLTLGITLFTDIAYFVFYGMFKATRSMVITGVLIVIEIIIYGLAVEFGADQGYAVDIANATLALVTASMAIILWSGQVMMDERGNPKEFKDFLPSSR